MHLVVCLSVILLFVGVVVYFTAESDKGAEQGHGSYKLIV